MSVAADAGSAPVRGTWPTDPARKDQTAHIGIPECGAHFCGTIQSAYNTAGQQVQTPNVGRRLFWNVEAVGGGAYDNGRVYVPLLGVEARAKMRLLDSNRLQVIACKAMVCDGQVWTRVQ